MNGKALNRILRYIGVGLLIGSIVFLSWRAQQGSVRTASGSARQPDPLLGTWVMIGDNGTGAAGTTADFRPDGTVVFTQNSTKTTIHYRREPGHAWVERRVAGLGMQGKDSALDQFKKPGVEMIEFAGPDGKFLDYGSSLLTLDPNRRVLYNILTQLWCRPGEEARVKAEFK
jgi:hypothetical protein